MASAKSKINHLKSRKLKWFLVSIIVVLIIARLLLPYFVLKYVNSELASLKGYYGHVEDIDIALIRGAYVINDIKIWKKKENENKALEIPFLDIEIVDLSIEWKALFKGSLVGEIDFSSPKMNFVRKKEKTAPNDIKSDTADFNQLIKKLMPLKINRFEINNGEIHYLDKIIDPQLDIAMKSIHALATNLTNVYDSAKVLPSRVDATGTAYDGLFNLTIDLNALEKLPTFDMNTELKQLNLVKLNDLLRAYSNTDVKKGFLTVNIEIAANKGKYTGYVKPLLSDLDIVQWNKEEGNVAQIGWETLVAFSAEVLQNQNKERLATKIPLEGDFVANKTDIGIWNSVLFLFKNAFIKALSPTIDKTIDINSVNENQKDKKGFFGKIFDNKDKKKKDKK
jgi:hypothetical protein